MEPRISGCARCSQQSPMAAGWRPGVRLEIAGGRRLRRAAFHASVGKQQAAGDDVGDERVARAPALSGLPFELACGRQTSNPGWRTSGAAQGLAGIGLSRQKEPPSTCEDTEVCMRSPVAYQPACTPRTVHVDERHCCAVCSAMTWQPSGGLQQRDIVKRRSPGPCGMAQRQNCPNDQICGSRRSSTLDV